jgi:ribosomal protein S18 acetylase RimI-like enzyme
MRSVSSAPVSIRPGRPDDAGALAAFGARTFRDAFGAENTAADMDLYVARAYGEATQRAELANPGMLTLLAEVDGQLAGYAQVREGDAPACVVGGDPIELWRFYVDGAWHGRGVAQALMRAVLDAARSRAARTIWLAVWERNPRAQAFYGKSGFVEVGLQPFVLGTDAQTDRVMARSLTAEAGGEIR